MKFNGYLILTLLILSSGSIFNILELNNLIVSIVFIVIFIVSIRTGVFQNKKFMTTLFILMFIMAIVFLIHAANYGDFSILFNNNNISMLLITITCALVCFFFNSKNTFLKYLNTILKVFILHGIISTLLISLFPTENVLITGAKETSVYVGYLNLFFQRIHINYLGYLDPTYISYFGFKLYRTHGMAWEPGNFSVYVNIFIFLNLFIFKNKRNSFIGIIAMILSWSTSGLLIMLIQFFYYFISNIKKFKTRFILPNILIASIAIYAIVIATIFNYNEKISGDKSGSGAVRIVNTIRSFQAITDNPLIGTGLFWESYTSELNSQLQSSKLASNKYIDSDKVNLNSAFTNSYLKLFVQLGIPIGIILTIAIFKQTLIPNNKILFAIIIILSVSSAPVLYFPFFFLFIVSGILKMLGVKQLPNKIFQHKYDRNLTVINLKEKN